MSGVAMGRLSGKSRAVLEVRPAATRSVHLKHDALFNTRVCRKRVRIHFSFLAFVHVEQGRQRGRCHQGLCLHVVSLQCSRWLETARGRGDHPKRTGGRSDRELAGD